MNSGPKLNRCYPDTSPPNAAAGPGWKTAGYLKGSSGCCGRVLPGKMCPSSMPAVRPVGDGFGTGKNKMSGWTSGGPFWPNWTNGASWTGASVSSTAASPPRKKGRLRGKNQKRQGNEVDGGGRRPRCSFGKPLGLGVPGGNHAGRKDAPDDSRSASGTGSSPTQAEAIGCRSGLRWRSLAKATGPAGDRTDLPAPEEPAEAGDPGWPLSAEIQATLESRTHLLLVWQLPPTGGSVRTEHPDVSCVLSCRVSDHNPQAVLKWLL
jgi:hypothetical protein